MLQKEEFIEKLLALYPTSPWWEKAFRAVSASCHVSEYYYQILFPGGVEEAYQYYEEMVDQKMLEILLTLEKPQKVREKIALALKVRVIDLGNKAELVCLPTFLKAGWNTSDKIWRYAGDISADFNYYSKRALLSGIYHKVRKRYLVDDSEEHGKTKEVIDSSIDQVLKMFSIKRKLPKMEDIPILRLFS